MMRDYWKWKQMRETVEPPVLVKVPGAWLGMAVPYLPKPGRLHIVVPYEVDSLVDLNAMQAMLEACILGIAA
jgi:hypothetical protein